MAASALLHVGRGAADANPGREAVNSPVWSTLDSIAIAKVVPSGALSPDRFLYSSNGRYVAFVVETAKVATDHVEADLRVYEVESLRAFADGGPPARPLYEVSEYSTTSEPAFSQLTWLEGQARLTFIRRQSGRGRLMMWSGVRAAVKQVGQSDVVGYRQLGPDAIAAFIDGRLKADAPTPPGVILVNGQSLRSLLDEEPSSSPFAPRQVAIINLSSGVSRELGVSAVPYLGFSASPDGRYLAFAEPLDAEWREGCWQSTEVTEADTPASQLAIVDLNTGKATRPFGAPIASTVLLGGPSQLLTWSPNGRHALVGFSFSKEDECSLSRAGRALPGAYILSAPDGMTQRLSTFPINVDGAVEFYPQAVRWSADSQRVAWQEVSSYGPFFRHGAPKTANRVETFSDVAGAWRRSKNPDIEAAPPSSIPVHLVLTEGNNELPSIRAVGSRGQPRELLSLAPQAQSKLLDIVEPVEWRDASGNQWRGLLARPRHQRAGERLPLILQTHGQDDGSFFAEGPSTSSYPGRAAVGRGFVVLTVYDLENLDVLSGERALEPVRMIDGYRAGIELLSAAGWIDSSLVGCIGWSRTAYYVKYALTHRPELCKTALVADGVDYGYWQYLVYMDWSESSFPLQYFATYGGQPWQHWPTWSAESPGLALPHVKVPVRIESNSGLVDALGEWEFYAGLRRLAKPVELVAYPGGAHSLVKPSQRFASTEGSLDWFDFWLNGAVRDVPSKAKTYARWIRMRENLARDRLLTQQSFVE